MNEDRLKDIGCGEFSCDKTRRDLKQRISLKEPLSYTMLLTSKFKEIGGLVHFFVSRVGSNSISALI